MTTDDQLENKNQYFNNTKKTSFDILDPSIVEKLEKMENIGPGFESNNINNIINILFKKHEIDLVTYLDSKLKLTILEELITIEGKLDNISVNA
ncbi:MAG TPA: hypothetical protein VFP49_14080 [Nitrososphaeraceae archaeon]|nr:hypothetical protein [Nitrososphaeraceae archaeon]